MRGGKEIYRKSGEKGRKDNGLLKKQRQKKGLLQGDNQKRRSRREVSRIKHKHVMTKLTILHFFANV